MKYEQGDIVTVDIRAAEDNDIDFELVEEDIGKFQILTIWSEDKREYFVEPVSDISGNYESYFVEESDIIERCSKHGAEKLYSKSEDDYICPFCNE